MAYHNVAVYGSLRVGMSNHKHFLRGSEYLESAWLEGANMYSLGGFPGIVPSIRNNDLVFVDIYKVDSHTLAALDSLEGVSAGMYSRQKKDLATSESGIMSAYVYYYEGSVRHLDHVKCGDWVKYKEVR